MGVSVVSFHTFASRTPRRIICTMALVAVLYLRLMETSVRIKSMRDASEYLAWRVRGGVG